MARWTGMRLPAWESLRNEMVARMEREGIDESELCAVKVEWPEGVNGISEAVPSCVRLITRGLRLQGYTVPAWAVQVVEGTYVHGAQLVMIYPQHPVHSRDEEYERSRITVHTSVPIVSTI